MILLSGSNPASHIVVARGPTPPITPSPFPDNRDAIEEIAASMDQSPRRSHQSHLKKGCLLRDNFRCMATGLIDENADVDMSGRFGPTELAHIIPFSLGQWDNSSQVCQENSSAFLQVADLIIGP